MQMTNEVTPKRKALADVQLDFAKRAERLKELTPSTAVVLLDYCEFKQWELGVEASALGANNMNRSAQILGAVNTLEEISAFMENILNPQKEVADE